MPAFKVVAEFEPRGDQPKAIEAISRAFREGAQVVTLLGATGTGKTATMAWVIEQLQLPTLVIAHNKTLAGQLAAEFKQFFPHNAVEYFVSYYDYYQPEAYVPQTDTYIEKDALINDEIDKLRHSATSSLFERKDVIVVASVSCISAWARRKTTGTWCCRCGWATRCPGNRSCASWWTSSTRATTWTSSGAPSGCGAT